MQKFVFPTVVLVLAAFLPMVLFGLTATHVLPELIQGPMLVIVYVLIGVLLSLLCLFLCVKTLQGENVKIGLGKTLGLGFVFFVMMLGAQLFLQKLLGQTLTNFATALLFGLSWYVILNQFKEYSIEQKQLYWTLIGSIMILLVYGFFLGFIGFVLAGFFPSNS